jgi:hypothetical protein
MAVIPAMKRIRQEYWEFKDNLGYIGSQLHLKKCG